MILIFSINDDYSTSRVINWLISLKKPFIRINENTIVDLISLEGQHFVVKIEDQLVNSVEITKIWYRRGGIDFFRSFDSSFLKAYLLTENVSLTQYFNYILDKKPSINNFRTREMNKLHLMDLCNKFSLLTPNSIVTSCKAALQKFFQIEKNIISKPLNAPFSILDANNFAHLGYTAEINLADIENLPDKFVPTFFQRNISKEYEVRAFYLNGNFRSMAIFSQNNKKTNVDFRNYDRDKPNRITPYELPISYQRKIKKMLDAIGLNCASFDVVFSKEDRNYYFLDLNPIGQFGMVSNPCNYNLEKEIALSL